MTKRKVEIFTAGCPICDDAVQAVKKLACPNCEVIVYNLNQGCATNECREKAKAYGVTRIPAVAVNGKLVSCCQGNALSEAALKAAGIGSQQ